MSRWYINIWWPNVNGSDLTMQELCNFVILASHSSQLEQAHANENNFEIHLAITLF